MLTVQLNPGLRGGKWARLRPLCGHDEASLGDADSVDPIAFLDRLLMETPGTTVGPGKAEGLAVCDCDRLFAAIYLKYYGNNIEGTIGCRGCSESFELNFSLQDWLSNVRNGNGRSAVGPDEEGVYTLSDGRRFRLPTAADQRSVIGLEAGARTAALFKRCVVAGDPLVDPELLQAAMGEVGPLLDLDLDAPCPNCGAVHRVHFDIQSYLMRVLGHEKRFLVREIHLIAVAYGWRYGEILSLTREDRRAFVRLIQAERRARRRVGP